MKKYFIIFCLFFITGQFLFAQTFYNDLIKSEKLQFQNMEKLSRLQYPGDSTIDVTYYKLNLTLTYQPQNLNGIVTVNFKSVSPSLTSFYLDLQNTLTVDSVTMNGSKISFTHMSGVPKLVINLPSPINHLTPHFSRLFLLSAN